MFLKTFFIELQSRKSCNENDEIIILQGARYKLLDYRDDFEWSLFLLKFCIKTKIHLHLILSRKKHIFDKYYYLSAFESWSTSRTSTMEI